MPRYIDAVKLAGKMMDAIHDGLHEEELLDIVNEQEEEDVAPVVHAKWIEDVYQDEPYVCSNCRWAEHDDMHRITGGYCVCCGAKMDEDIPEDIPMEYFENGGI